MRYYLFVQDDDKDGNVVVLAKNEKAAARQLSEFYDLPSLGVTVEQVYTLRDVVVLKAI